MRSIQFKIMLTSFSIVGWAFIVFLYCYSYYQLRIDEQSFGIFGLALLAINIATWVLLKDETIPPQSNENKPITEGQ